MSKIFKNMNDKEVVALFRSNKNKMMRMYLEWFFEKQKNFAIYGNEEGYIQKLDNNEIGFIEKHFLENPLQYNILSIDKILGRE